MNEHLQMHKDFKESWVSAFVCDLTVDDLSKQISTPLQHIRSFIYVPFYNELWNVKLQFFFLLFSQMVTCCFVIMVLATSLGLMFSRSLTHKHTFRNGSRNSYQGGQNINTRFICLVYLSFFVLVVLVPRNPYDNIFHIYLNKICLLDTLKFQYAIFINTSILI
jgi:hypothetical protein